MSKTTANNPTAVTVATSDTAILAANAGRRELTIVNNDATNYIELGFGATAVAGAGLRLAPKASFTTNTWQGSIRGIANTAACVVSAVEW